MRNWFGRRSPDREADLDREIEAHLASEAQELLEAGLPPEEAQAAARRSFGNLALAKEDTRQVWPGQRLDTLVRDLRYALRHLRRSPGYAIWAIASLALGIGVNTAIFGLLNAIVLRPLPYADADRIVWLTQILKANSTDELTLTPDFLDWRLQQTSFSLLAAYNYQARTLSGHGDPAVLRGVKASADLLPLLGVEPRRGRNFRRAEDVRGNDTVVILTHRLWQDRFGGDPGMISRSITLDGQPFTVVGVLPQGFAFPGRQSVDLLTPLGKNEAAELARQGWAVTIVHNVIGRLKPGVTAEQAHAELKVIQSRLPVPPFKPQITIRMMPLREHLTGEFRLATNILLAAASLLLLIACANVTNLLLARAVVREREMAIRATLGGSRPRLIRQLLVECGVLAAAACVAGIFMAAFTRKSLLALGPERLPDHLAQGLAADGGPAGFAICLSLVTVLLFGLLPALRVTSLPAAEALKAGGRAATGGPRRTGFLSLVAAGQIAITLILLTAAGLLLHSFWRLRYRNLGFEPERLLAASMKVPPGAAGQFALFDEVLSRARSIPGVELAAMTESAYVPPGEGHATNTFRVEGQAVPPPGQRPVANHQPVSADYFALLRIPLWEGRLLRDSDTESATPVIVVNRALVRRVFGRENPLGRRIRTGIADDPWRMIVGVVGDVKTSGLVTRPEPTIYYPLRQSGGLFAASLVVRTALDPRFVAGELRRQMANLLDRMPMIAIQTLDRRLNESAAKPRITAIMLSAFAALATFLGVIGVYGVMACRVRWQARELAVRQALGALPLQISAEVLRQGFRIVVPGLAAGLVGALAISRLLRGLLFEVKPYDPLAWLAAMALLAVVALLACYLPARRAARFDPMTTLREE